MVNGDAADGAWSVLVTFLVVSYWRGGWLLQDFYGCSQPLAFCSADAAEHEASGLASELWGLGLALAAILSRHQLARCCRRAPARAGETDRRAAAAVRPSDLRSVEAGFGQEDRTRAG